MSGEKEGKAEVHVSTSAASEGEKKPRSKIASIIVFGKYAVFVSSLLLNAIVVGYYGFYGHRTRVNEGLIAQYAKVQEAQDAVFDIVLKTIPSRRNSDREPNLNEIELSLQKLEALQKELSKLNDNSAYLQSEAYAYQEAIGSLATAIISIKYDAPRSLSVAQAAFHEWDVAANDLKEAVDNRTTSFWKTVWEVV